MKNPAAERLDYIDCLRGVAIGGVVLVHAGQLIGNLPGWLRSAAGYGGHGVALFFILSALTLVSVYTGRQTAWRSFWLRRWFRLAPMFYLGILAYLCLRGAGPSVNAPDGIGARQIVLTLLFLHGWMFDSINSVVPGGWSIGNEAMFYLLFPLLLRFLNTGRRTAIMLIAAAAVSRLSYMMIPHWFAGMTTPELLNIFAAFCFLTQFPAFICGFAAYFIIQRLDDSPALRNKFLTHGAFALAAALLIGLAASNQKSLANYLLADFVLIPLVVAVRFSQTPLIVNAVLRHIGKVSYSIYIIHFAVIDWARIHGLPGLADFDPGAQLAIVYVSVLAVATALATLTYRWIELPMIELGRKTAVRFESENNSR